MISTNVALDRLVQFNAGHVKDMAECASRALAEEYVKGTYHLPDTPSIRALGRLYEMLTGDLWRWS
jgi:hypothetical protein